MPAYDGQGSTALRQKISPVWRRVLASQDRTRFPRQQKELFGSPQL
jgi:hypothetical protein